MYSSAGKNGNREGFFCLSGDISDLTTVALQRKLWSGSWAYCMDTGDAYLWDLENEQWRIQ